jgi:hypothetical protein
MRAEAPQNLLSAKVSSGFPGYTQHVAQGAAKAGRGAASPVTVPKGRRAPAGWSGKIEEAIKARESAKEARKGKPISFPHAFSKR